MDIDASAAALHTKVTSRRHLAGGLNGRRWTYGEEVLNGPNAATRLAVAERVSQLLGVQLQRVTVPRDGLTDLLGSSSALIAALNEPGVLTLEGPARQLEPFVTGLRHDPISKERWLRVPQQRGLIRTDPWCLILLSAEERDVTLNRAAPLLSSAVLNGR